MTLAKYYLVHVTLFPHCTIETHEIGWKVLLFVWDNIDYYILSKKANQKLVGLFRGFVLNKV